MCVMICEELVVFINEFSNPQTNPTTITERAIIAKLPQRKATMTPEYDLVKTFHTKQSIFQQPLNATFTCGWEAVNSQETSFINITRSTCLYVCIHTNV